MCTGVVGTLEESQMLVSSSAVYPPVWQLARHHAEHTAEAQCGSVSSWMGVGYERKGGIRTAQGLWPEQQQDVGAVDQDGETAGWDMSRCSGGLFCPFYM